MKDLSLLGSTAPGSTVRGKGNEARKEREPTQGVTSSVMLCVTACLIPQHCPIRCINTISSQSVQGKKVD